MKFVTLVLLTAVALILAAYQSAIEANNRRLCGVTATYVASGYEWAGVDGICRWQMDNITGGVKR